MRSNKWWEQQGETLFSEAQKGDQTLVFLHRSENEGMRILAGRVGGQLDLVREALSYLTSDYSLQETSRILTMLRDEVLLQHVKDLNKKDKSHDEK